MNGLLSIFLGTASIASVIQHVNDPVSPGDSQTGKRMLFLDALRAFASVMILLHHFALYPPLSENARPILGAVVDWFSDYARMTQVFFVVGGYVMARSMSARQWGLSAAGEFLIQRYCRLGIPYLAAILLAIAASAFSRGWLQADVVGTPLTLSQFVAHLFFLQELLGYEHLSAGLWFVCINFQMGLIYVIMLCLRDTLARWRGAAAGENSMDPAMIVGWGISLLSLFYFNVDSKWDSWVMYFFPYFFMGVVIHRAMQNKRSAVEFWLYVCVVMIAVAFDWRWRLVNTVLVGLLLFGADKTGLATRWPKSRLIASMGKVSYCLFLVHFPVLLMVASLWERLNWTSPYQAIAGLLTAFLISVATSFGFYRYIERPSVSLSRIGSKRTSGRTEVGG